ncbi:MAG TPA: transglutaminaseTgpA domain-containing protein [Acidimicrobiia bacterium]
MGRRIGQLAAFIAFIIMIGRLGRLLAVGRDQPQWNLILVAATFLGAIAWWLLGQVTNRRALKLVIFSVGGLLLAFRIMTPETLAFGVLPTGASLGVMGEEVAEAFRIIRSGVPPVPANPGLLAILAAVMWVIGALFTWGSTDGPYAALFLPPLIMYFQFAVFDREQAGLGWMGISGVVLGLAAVSMALERRGETGRARDESGRAMPRRSLNLAAITAIFLTVGAVALASNASTWINEYGNAPWRSGGAGYGDGPGGSSFDGLVDLRQRVLNLSDEPVFVANLGSGAPPANQVYWRMETLDTFDNEAWDRSNRSYDRFQPGQPLANEYDTYQGTTYDFLANIRIEDLVSSVAPTAGVPVDILDPPSEGNGRPPIHFNTLPDSAIVATPELRRDDSYQVRTVYPAGDVDLGVLATGDDGQLTPMFAAMAASGDFPHVPGPADPAVQPPDLEFYTTLPGSLPSGIESRARSLTALASSNMERAFILEDWFRRTGSFQYSTDVSTGHDSLRLDDWLNDSTSRNYRRGYCEQFAAAMAVMARTIGIPSRVVWGFTPGEITEVDGEQIVVVRERNAHAWLELWMEPYGWVQFDPTPRREATGYTEQPESITAGFDPEEHLLTDDAPGSVTQPSFPDGVGDVPAFIDDAPVPLAGGGPRWWLFGVLALIPLTAAIPLMKRARRRRRLHRIREGDVTAAWDEIVDRLADLGEPVSPSLTPIEAARTIDPALLPLAVSYAAAVYGGRRGQARESDFFGAELWLDSHYDTSAKARAAVSVRSLVKRG